MCVICSAVYPSKLVCISIKIHDFISLFQLFTAISFTFPIIPLAIHFINLPLALSSRFLCPQRILYWQFAVRIDWHDDFHLIIGQFPPSISQRFCSANQFYRF